MVKAIIFDCFGVLATDGLLPFRERYFGDNPKLMEEARELGHRVDAGLGGYEEYLAHLAKMADITVEEARRQIESNVPDEKLFAYISKELKPNYKIGMLSNAGANWLEDIFTPEQIALFDAVALSYETGFTKPDPRSYQTVARKLGVAPGECVLVDDLERYCTGAREAGMRAVWYKNSAQFKQDFEKLIQS